MDYTIFQGVTKKLSLHQRGKNSYNFVDSNKYGININKNTLKLIVISINIE